MTQQLPSSSNPITPQPYVDTTKDVVLTPVSSDTSEESSPPLQEEATAQEFVSTPEQEEIFNQFLQGKYGVTREQFEEAYSSYSQQPEEFSQQQAHNTLSKSWGVPLTEVQTRLTVLKEKYGEYFEQNPQFDTIEGVQQVWDIYSKTLPSAPNRPDKQTSLLTSIPTKPSYKFTQSQINKMSNEEKGKNWSAIVEAYANNAVDLTS